MPLFLFVYTRIYGGIGNSDTGKFYHDVKVISDYGKTDLSFLFRLLFGLQNDEPGSEDYMNVLQRTLNWDNGTVKDYLYNDNRIVIRVHVLLDLLALGSYPAHALLNCFLSFTGIYFFYKTFREWFPGKEIYMLLILCFFPALWFYTGALLKEGLVLFTLGCLLYQLKQVINGIYTIRSVAWLLFLLFVSLLLKPYLLFFAALFFTLFFTVLRSVRIKKKIMFFLAALLVIVFSVNSLSVLVKQRSLLAAALKHQHLFAGVSQGGIFLHDAGNFIRLKNDTNLVERVPGKKDVFKIKENTAYMYWKTTNLEDTLYCAANKDTISHYQLAYIIQQSQSNIKLPQSNALFMTGSCFYYTLFYPAFFNARNALQILASLENLLVVIALFIITYGIIRSKKEKYLPFLFLFFALSMCLLIGITAPNSGAIFRYRSPAMVFLLLAALYFLPESSDKRKSPESKPGAIK